MVRTERRKLGDFGERVAQERLRATGLEVLAANVRTASGEIDLVAREGELTVCIEVRTRRAGSGSASATLTSAKVARMWACALEYAEANAIPPELLRVDALTLDLDGAGRLLGVEHFVAIEVPSTP